VAAAGRSLDQRRCSHSNFFFANVVKPMVLATFCWSKSRFPYKTNGKSTFLPYKYRRGRKKPKKSQIKPAKTRTKNPADAKNPRKAR